MNKTTKILLFLSGLFLLYVVAEYVTWRWRRAAIGSVTRCCGTTAGRSARRPSRRWTSCRSRSTAGRARTSVRSVTSWSSVRQPVWERCVLGKGLRRSNRNYWWRRRDKFFCGESSLCWNGLIYNFSMVGEPQIFLCARWRHNMALHGRMFSFSQESCHLHSSIAVEF